MLGGGDGIGGGEAHGGGGEHVEIVVIIAEGVHISVFDAEGSEEEFDAVPFGEAGLDHFEDAVIGDVFEVVEGAVFDGFAEGGVEMGAEGLDGGGWLAEEHADGAGDEGGCGDVVNDGDEAGVALGIFFVEADGEEGAVHDKVGRRCWTFEVGRWGGARRGGRAMAHVLIERGRSGIDDDDGRAVERAEAGDDVLDEGGADVAGDET